MNWLCRIIGLFSLMAGSLLSCAGTLAQFRTPLGNLEVELFDADKPATVENFLRYVKSGAYNKMIFHRWKPGFVIQGGGFYVASRSGTNSIDPIPIFGTVTNEYNVGRTFSNVYGTLAMARVGGATNSASSQWFFNLANNAFLDSVDGGFTVFGRVVSGTNVLNRFNNTSSSNSIFRLALGSPLEDLPVLSATPTFQDLAYADISLLSVQVMPKGAGGREISWMSVSNRPNHLEFTTDFPRSWKILVSTNGTGKTIQIQDPDTASSSRFYRVRVDY